MKESAKNDGSDAWVSFCGGGKPGGYVVVPAAKNPGGPAVNAEFSDESMVNLGPRGVPSNPGGHAARTGMAGFTA